VISIGLKILYSFLYREYINHIHLLSTYIAKDFKLLWYNSKICKEKTNCQAWWFKTIFPALRRVKKEDLEFEAGFNYPESSWPN
jgi:hypothetical protein